MAFEFELPDVGEGIHEGEIVNWLVDEGDQVDEDEDIVEVMTDKATVQISSPIAGTIQDLRFGEGDVVEVGQTFVVIEPAEGAQPADRQVGSDTEEPSTPPDTPEGQPEQPEPTETSATPEPSASTDRTDGHRPQRTPHGILAPPSVRIEARKRGIDIAQVDGSGPAGRVTMDDLDSHQPTTEEPEAAPSASAGGLGNLLPVDLESPSVNRDHARQVEPVRAGPRSPKAHAARAMRLQPHFTHAVEVRADELVADVEEAARDAEDELDLVTAFVVKAVASGLDDNERCNAWVDEESRDLVIADRINVAVARPTPDGLELATVADADEAGVLEIARTLAEGGDESVEATFTVTSFDGDGGLVSTPVLVHPQVAGVAAGAIRDVGVVDGDQIQPGKELSLAFTFDHRYLDGYGGARLAEDVEDLLSSPGSMLLG